MSAVSVGGQCLRDLRDLRAPLVGEGPGAEGASALSAENTQQSPRHHNISAVFTIPPTVKRSVRFSFYAKMNGDNGA